MSEPPPDLPRSDDTERPPTPTMSTASSAKDVEAGSESEEAATRSNYFLDMEADDINWATDPTHFDANWLESQGLFASAVGPEEATENPKTPCKKVLDAEPIEKNSSTPFRMSTQDRLSSSEEVRKVILEELGKKLYFVEHWANILYRKEAPLKDVVKFLNKRATGYSGGRWNNLPEVATVEEDIYAPLVDIISRIIQEFSTTSEDGVTREALDTSSVVLQHKDAKNHGTLPDISIKASGPSFEGLRKNAGTTSQAALGVGWSNVAAVFEVKRDKVKGSVTSHAKQIALYCRQILMHQPNRNFVRTLIITEQHVCLAHFDRSGLYLTPYINIHKDPYTFIRLIVGLTTYDEAVLGFDTSVQWIVDQETGLRVSGTLKAFDEKTKTTTYYELCMKSTPFIRASIRGRGTTCYRAINPDTKKVVVIKDSWRTETRTPETAFLDAALEVDGVVQCLAYQNNCAETKAFRPRNAVHEDFHNRVKSRVVMEHYGGSLTTFTHRHQLIAAFRDAILGHQSLLHKGILHRDIGMNNILLGLPQAKPGCRGIIIDLDMAVWIIKNMPKPNQDARTASEYCCLGAQRYQSFATIYSRMQNLPPLYDFLDDLESIFFVLLDILLLYRMPGDRIKNTSRSIDKYMKNMDSRDLSVASSSKSRIMAWRLAEVSPWWGKMCDVLLKDYQKMVFDVAQDKENILEDSSLTADEKYDKLKAMGSVELSASYYTRVTEAFDKALSAIEADDEEIDDAAFARQLSSPCPPERVARRSTAAIPPPDLQNNLKRRSEALHSDVTHVKRAVKNVRGAQPSEQEEEHKAESDEED
ncbi:hypothetical protein DFP72DRAFT_1091891 [Ephemerocybe angulata]|uniref:Fungal-type protein kinase domain-containing protein n=1 Tax=Ephemerocybe angulata TaxID=980116 RepID=A0A8H6IA92_9AGAR|nr:hypothetical protein DFP72DRAFT_1091891 [Tulosesus angulatus]